MSLPTEFIPFARPVLGAGEEEAVLRVMRSGWLTTGEEAARFEEEFAAFAEVPHALAVSSATAGLHLALEAVGVAPGTRVLTTPYTFAASAEVIRYLGADPLFVDVREDTFDIDPAGVERALGGREERISAVLPVHVAGLPCDMQVIRGAAAARRVPVVEDAAHTLPDCLGACPPEPPSCRVYSFYATKPITTGEGGMVTTPSETVARRMRRMRLHGIDREVWERYTSARAAWYYQVVEAGYKYNLPDLAAAIGRVQLRRAGELRAAREAIAAAYREGLADLDCLRLPEAAPTQAGEGRHSWHLFLLRLVAERLTVDRDRFVELLVQAGVGASVHFIPLHLMPYYRHRYGLRPEDFPAAMRCYRSVVSLPIYPGMSEDQVRRVIRAVRITALRHYRRQGGRRARGATDGRGAGRRPPPLRRRGNPH